MTPSGMPASRNCDYLGSIAYNSIFSIPCSTWLLRTVQLFWFSTVLVTKMLTVSPVLLNLPHKKKVTVHSMWMEMTCAVKILKMELGVGYELTQTVFKLCIMHISTGTKINSTVQLQPLISQLNTAKCHFCIPQPKTGCRTIPIVLQYQSSIWSSYKTFRCEWRFSGSGVQTLFLVLEGQVWDQLQYKK